MKVYIGTDHRGTDRELQIINYLNVKKIKTIECTIPHTPTDDYVDFAKDICTNVAKDKDSVGILICGSGIGMSIAANKIKGIRAARCVSVRDAISTRIDNDANVLCLSYETNEETTYEIVDAFLNTPFSNEERHIRRINKIADLER